MECYGSVFFIRVMQQLDNKCYMTLLQQLRGSVITKCSAKSINGVLFHHNNAPAHKSAVAMATTRDCSFEFTDHPLYSTGLAPLDLHLF